jgi:hypothetical protein
MRTLIRLTEVVSTLELLVEWMERNPGAAESAEVRGRVQELRRRVGRLCEAAQPVVKRGRLSGAWGDGAGRKTAQNPLTFRRRA